MNTQTSSNPSSPRLQVFYDGLCRLCAAEIEHYMKKEGAEKIDFIDITSRDFEASQHGLDPYQVNKYFHVKTPEGEILTGPPAFREIWKRLEGFALLVKISGWRPVMFFAHLGYTLFAEIRPYLPKRAQSLCESSPYCEIKPQGKS